MKNDKLNKKNILVSLVLTISALPLFLLVLLKSKQVILIEAKKNGEWFKVGINDPINKDIEFKWWIID